LSRPLSSLA